MFTVLQKQQLTALRQKMTKMIRFWYIFVLIGIFVPIACFYLLWCTFTVKKKKTWVFFNIRLQWWVALSINLIKSFSNIISVILEFIDCKQWPNKENVIDLDEKTSLIKTPAGRNANLASMLIYYTCVSYDSQ